MRRMPIIGALANGAIAPLVRMMRTTSGIRLMPLSRREMDPVGHLEQNCRLE